MDNKSIISQLKDLQAHAVAMHGLATELIKEAEKGKVVKSKKISRLEENRAYVRAHMAKSMTRK